MRIGLLGGSFNPAHAGHRHIAEAFARALRLDQVWLLVSPGNPLKPASGMAPFAQRLASARRIADGRRIIATDIEARLHTRYTADTLRALCQRHPRTHFVWLMGADGFAELPRWRRWTTLISLAPIAVHARLGSDRAALAGVAAHRWRRLRQPARQLAPPGWAFLALARHGASASALRAAGFWLNSSPVPNSRVTAKDSPDRP